MTLFRTLVLCGTAALLGACNASPAPDTPQPPKPQAASASTALADSNPFKPMLHDRDRAKNVQNIVNKQAKAQRKAIKQAQQ